MALFSILRAPQRAKKKKKACCLPEALAHPVEPISDSSRKATGNMCDLHSEISKNCLFCVTDRWRHGLHRGEELHPPRRTRSQHPRQWDAALQDSGLWPGQDNRVRVHGSRRYPARGHWGGLDCGPGLEKDKRLERMKQCGSVKMRD